MTVCFSKTGRNIVTAGSCFSSANTTATTLNKEALLFIGSVKEALKWFSRKHLLNYPY